MIPNLEKPNLDWDISKKIFIKENVLTSQVCEELIDSQVELLQKGIDKYPSVFTTSFDSCLLPLSHPIHYMLQDTYKEIIEFFKFDITFAEPYEVKRYVKDDYFDQHFDNYYCLKDNVDRKITIVVLLADEATYLGGNIKVLNQHYAGKQGSIIAFPSFFPHSVEPVSNGERWSLISWLWGNYWR